MFLFSLAQVHHLAAHLHYCLHTFCFKRIHKFSKQFENSNQPLLSFSIKKVGQKWGSVFRFLTLGVRMSRD